MRGSDIRTGELFFYVDLEERVPKNHPLRLIRRIVNEALPRWTVNLRSFMQRRATIDRAGAAVAGAFVAGVLIAHHERTSLPCRRWLERTWSRTRSI
jgi:hypothetical protein